MNIREMQTDNANYIIPTATTNQVNIQNTQKHIQHTECYNSK